MARLGFGRGEYKYFGYPLPPLIQAMRPAVYVRLRPIANRWNRALGLQTEFPEPAKLTLAACHVAGQTRPTPLLLKYQTGDYNCLHQDLYGDLFFRLQAAFLLSVPGRTSPEESSC